MNFAAFSNNVPKITLFYTQAPYFCNKNAAEEVPQHTPNQDFVASSFKNKFPKQRLHIINIAFFVSLTPVFIQSLGNTQIRR